MTVSTSSDAAEQRSRQIANQLRNDILCGRIAEGMRLTEAGLSERFGVGRGLVREAVQQLSIQGLLVTRRNRGAAVAPEAPREIRQLIVPIRRTIEVYALRLVFDELTDADFDAWEAILQKMDSACAAGDYHAVAELDIAFHRQLLERSAQADLVTIWEALVGRIRSHFQRTQRRYSKLHDVVEEHRQVLDGFRRGDLDRAVQLLEANIE